MKKNIFVIMLALMAIATGAWAKSYGLYIGGTQVTDNNMNSLSSIEGVERGTITFNGSTLTLTDVLIDMAGFSVNGITISQTGITLKLVGTNRIISDYAALCVGATTTINGPGKLEAYSKQNGILARPQSSSVTTGSLTIQNNACIDATGASRGIYDESKIFNVYIKGEETVVEAEGKLGESFYNFKSITLYNGLKVIMPNSAKIKDGSVVDGDAENIVVKYERVRIAFPEGLPINEANFPDNIFRKYVSNKLDSDGDGYLTDQEIAAVTEINISVDVSSTDAYDRTKEYKKIATLQGIEYFTALTTFKCSSCNLPSLDLSNNLALTYLDCSLNQNLTSLDISKNTALEHLECSYCKLTSLDVSIFPALTYLSCMGKWLTSLDVSNNLALTTLYCDGNSLNTLYVWNNTELTSLDCSNCNLSSIDLSNNRKLTNLICENNPMGSIDVSNNTMLTAFTCMGCQLTSLDVSQNTALQKLWCDENQLTSLDVSNNTALEILRCDKNRLTSLNVNNTSLNYLRCSQNRLKGVEMDEVIAALPGTGGDFYAIAPNDGNEQNVVTVKQVAAAKQKHWTTYYMYSDYDWREYAGLTPPAGLAIDEINFPDAIFRKYVGNNYDNGDGVLTDAEIAAVTEMNVSGKGIADLTGIEHFTELTTLFCGYNSITSLDVSALLKLKYLECSNNQLTSLNLLNNTALKYLFCSSNQLTSLDVSQNDQLIRLDCSLNQLTSLSFWNNPCLKSLYCEMNQIKGTSMDLLVSSLPQRDERDGDFYAIILTDPNERNVVTTTQAQVADQRGWTTYGYVTDRWEQYTGSEPVRIAINAANFPDPNFRAWVKANCQSDGDNWLVDEEIAAVTEMNVSGQGIADLTGIEYFTDLTVLRSGYNSITSLDLSALLKLEFLECSNNQLTWLDVSALLKLETLNCNNNQLTELDVSNNTALNSLYCLGNQLPWIDLSNNDQLSTLYCSFNQLAWLEFWNNPCLKALRCEMNQIKGAAMTQLISSLPRRDERDGGFYAISLSDPDEQNVVTTTQVQLADQKGWITYGHVTNGWEEYAGSEPTGIAINATNFPDANFRTWVKENLQEDGDEVLTDEEIELVWKIDVSEQNIADLTGIELFPGLQNLYCSNNQMTSLDVSHNENLRTLYCDNNNLQSIDVSNCPRLYYLSCNYIGLTSLDVSSNTYLECLDCVGNQLTSLDFSNNPMLRMLWCQNNQIQGTDMSNLVNSLPEVEGNPGEFCVMYYTNEHNVITTAQVAIAKGKNWKVKIRNSDGRTSDYEGVSDVATSISSVSGDATTDSPVYSLDGQRVSGKPTKKGVYVKDGRKVVVK